MLAPESRVLLMDQLAPPPGCRMDAAVATTFTLDLTATLLPALAFTGFHLASGTSDPIATLEALRSTGDRMDVFCQAGAITVPDRAPDLLAFLEPMVHPVSPPGVGLFHPKVWFVRYTDEEGAPTFRLLVLTRNLTLDPSWDLSVRLDSACLEGRQRPGNEPLRDFIASLAERTTPALTAERAERIAALARDAHRVVWEVPRDVEDLGFHYLDPGRPLTADFSGSRHLVVSPFVDTAGLDHVSRGGAVEVLSRAEELDKLDPRTTARLSARILDDLAVVQEVEGSRLAGQLHAKMFVVEQTRKWTKSHVFIGSANATGAAFTINTEFMVELRGPKKWLGIDRFLGADGDFLGLTEPYEPDGESPVESEDLAQRELDNALRRVARMTYRVEVLPLPQDTAGAHTLRLRSDGPFNLEPLWSATAELLTVADQTRPVSPGSSLDAVLEGVSTADISPFLAIRIESPAGLRAATVVVAELINAPEDRLDVILARQIDSPEKFLRFLYFLLSLGSPGALAALAASSDGSDGHTAGSPFGPGGSGVLELVLGAIASRTSALEDLDALVRRLQVTEDGRAALPDGFPAFWSVVRQAAGLGEAWA